MDVAGDTHVLRSCLAAYFDPAVAGVGSGLPGVPGAGGGPVGESFGALLEAAEKLPVETTPRLLALPANVNKARAEAEAMRAVAAL